jgi:hypothetical protein
MISQSHSLYFYRVSGLGDRNHSRMRSAVFWVIPQATGWAQLAAYYYCFLSWLTLRPWRWRWHVLPKRQFPSDLRVQDIKTQKAVLFMVTSVRTSNPTEEWILKNIVKRKYFAILGRSHFSYKSHQNCYYRAFWAESRDKFACRVCVG